MEFGEIRSRIHNEEQISWGEIKELSKQDNYEAEIVPYLSSFPEYWESFSVVTILGINQFQEFAAIAPYASFRAVIRWERIDRSWEAPWKNLHSLVLEECRIDSFFFHKEELSKLGELVLRYNTNDFSLRDFSKKINMELLCSSHSLRSLKRLSFDNFTIGLEGLRILTNSPLCENLTYLSLRDCPIGGDKGARLLLKSPYLTNLQILSLNLVGLHYNTREALRKRFSKVY